MKSILPDYAWVKTQQGRRAKILTWPDKTRQEKNITTAHIFWAYIDKEVSRNLLASYRLVSQNNSTQSWLTPSHFDSFDSQAESKSDTCNSGNRK